MKTIIYATDCTISDASSLQYAYRFSSIMNAELHILHVYQFPPISFSIIKSTEVLRKRFKKEQKEILTRFCETHLKNEFRQKPVKTHSIENISIADGILDVTKKLSPDLVILGIKDSHSNRGYFSGNIANELLDKIEIPVLMVPNNISFNGISTIVYATDFEEEDILFIKKLVEIAHPFDALIVIVHVYKSNLHSIKQNMEKFKNTLLKEISYPEITFRNIASGKVKSGLLSVLKNENANMLVMLERNHKWTINNMFHKDLVKDMEATLALPILAFNKKRTKTKPQKAKTIKTKNVIAF